MKGFWLPVALWLKVFEVLFLPLDSSRDGHTDNQQNKNWWSKSEEHWPEDIRDSRRSLSGDISQDRTLVEIIDASEHPQISLPHTACQRRTSQRKTPVYKRQGKKVLLCRKSWRSTKLPFLWDTASKCTFAMSTTSSKATWNVSPAHLHSRTRGWALFGKLAQAWLFLEGYARIGGLLVLTLAFRGSVLRGLFSRQSW